MANATFLQMTVAQRVSIGMLYAVVSVIALFLHTLSLTAVFRTPGSRKVTFNILILNLSVAECCLFILYLVYAAPSALSGTAIFGEGSKDIAGHVQDYVYFPTTFTTLLIALNRAIAIGEFRIPISEAAKPKFVYALLGSTWLVAIIAPTINMYANSCWTRFDTHSFIFMHACTDLTQSPVSPTIRLDLAVIYGVAILYAYCIWKLWRKGRQVQVADIQINMAGHQRRLLYIALCIWIPTAGNIIGRPRYQPFKCPYLYLLLF